MLVTQVTELSKSRSKVYIDQKFAFVLYKGELRLYHIKEGEELRTEDYPVSYTHLTLPTTERV